MAINKKLIHFQTLANFNAQLSAGNILDTSIVFIKDAKKIWTHGQLYDCSEGGGAESPVYVTDFTLLEWTDTYDMEALADAVTNNKTIIIPWGGEWTGYSVVNNVTIDDDFITLFCHLNSERNPLSNYSGEVYINLDRAGRCVDELLTYSGQQLLEDGFNIKTINGESILGRGNITIQGGSGGGSAAYPIVNHGTNDTTFTLTPNTFHVWGEVSSLDLSFGAEQAGVANEYLFQFTSGSGGTTLALPGDIKWANDTPPTIAENMIYQVSILKGLASVLEFSNAPSITIINFTIRNFSCTAEEGMTWEQWVLSEYNTVNCTFMGNNIQRTGEIVGTSYTTYVTKTDVITSDFAYTLIPMT